LELEQHLSKMVRSLFTEKSQLAVARFTTQKPAADGCLEGEQAGIIGQAVQSGQRNDWRGAIIDLCLQKQIQRSVELYYSANDDKKKY
jgi:hypothetical protein